VSASPPDLARHLLAHTHAKLGFFSADQNATVHECIEICADIDVTPELCADIEVDPELCAAIECST